MERMKQKGRWVSKLSPYGGLEILDRMEKGHLGKHTLLRAQNYHYKGRKNHRWFRTVEAE